MKRLRFDMVPDPEMERAKEAQIQSILSDGRIQHFLVQNKLDRNFLQKNAGRLDAWRKELDLCKNCTGLDHCRQKFAGRVLNLLVEDGFLEEVYEACRFGKESEKNRAHQKNFRLYHGSRSDLEIDLATLDMQGERMEYIQSWKSVMNHMLSGKGVYLYGQPGTGKTFLALGAANKAARSGQSVSFVKVPSLMQDYKQSLQDPEYRQSLTAALKHSDVVVFDDIGSESITPWTRDEILLPILDYRMQEGKSTWFTSNYTPDELKTQYARSGEDVAALRLMERIRTLADACELKGASRR